MYWKDEGYLLSKNNFDENSIIIEAFTLKHGKYTGLVYGGSSKKQKKFFLTKSLLYMRMNLLHINYFLKDVVNLHLL